MATRLMIACVSGAAALLAACASTPPRPAYITHVVLIKLKDPGEAPALLADSERTLARLPGISAFAAGRHIDIGRAGILQDYDVAFYMGFESADDYRAYNDHPDHIRVREFWRPKFESIRIVDFADPTP